MSDKPDLSALFSILSKGNETQKPEEILSTLLEASQKNSTADAVSGTENASHNTDSSSTSEVGNAMPDLATMMRILQLIKSSNQDSPSKELLKSLKPFLNDARKEKVDQYIKILGLTKALEMMNEIGDVSQ